LPRLVIVSNRVAVPDRADKASAGGLAVALQEAFQEYQGLWFGWSGRVAAQPDLRPTIVEKERVQYAVIDLTPRDRQEYYNGFANRALWPTMHYRVGLSDFSRADYLGYRRVNHTFARALAPFIHPDDLVWVHDYHLIPFAEELRGLNFSNRIGYFQIVNPNDKLEVAEAIRDALHMEKSERVTRWQAMIGPLRKHDVSWWAAAFLKELA
jgi:trehalose 6-phosphate synthase